MKQDFHNICIQTQQDLWESKQNYQGNYAVGFFSYTDINLNKFLYTNTHLSLSHNWQFYILG